MTVYLLDNDTLSLALRGRHQVLARIETARADATIGLSRPVWAEAVRGRIARLLKAADGADFVRADDELRKTLEFLAEFTVVPSDAAAGRHLDRLRAGKKTWKGGHADLLIACVALSYSATLVTRNTKDFAGIPGLKVENWAD